MTATEPTVEVRGQDVRVGDDLWAGSVPHRITRVEDYRHPSFPGELWHSGSSDGPGGVGKAAWGMTLETNVGYAGHYEISVRAFGCAHCRQPIHRIGYRDGDPADPWEQTTGWTHDKGGVFCDGTEQRAERGPDLGTVIP